MDKSWQSSSVHVWNRQRMLGFADRDNGQSFVVPLLFANGTEIR
ncbi:hypothetical protein [Paenibacillus sp. PCH8]|nr:hypothetical protein [Paenibacillus sp. PCH8]